jgi:hypothetical protein
MFHFKDDKISAIFSEPRETRSLFVWLVADKPNEQGEFLATIHRHQVKIKPN